MKNNTSKNLFFFFAFSSIYIKFTNPVIDVKEITLEVQYKNTFLTRKINSWLHVLFSHLDFLIENSFQYDLRNFTRANVPIYSNTILISNTFESARLDFCVYYIFENSAKYICQKIVLCFKDQRNIFLYGKVLWKIIYVLSRKRKVREGPSVSQCDWFKKPRVTFAYDKVKNIIGANHYVVLLFQCVER